MSYLPLEVKALCLYTMDYPEMCGIMCRLKCENDTYLITANHEVWYKHCVYQMQILQLTPQELLEKACILGYVLQVHFLHVYFPVEATLCKSLCGFFEHNNDPLKLSIENFHVDVLRVLFDHIPNELVVKNICKDAMVKNRTMRDNAAFVSLFHIILEVTYTVEDRSKFGIFFRMAELICTRSKFDPNWVNTNEESSMIECISQRYDEWFTDLHILMMENRILDPNDGHGFIPIEAIFGRLIRLLDYLVLRGDVDFTVAEFAVQDIITDVMDKENLEMVNYLVNHPEIVSEKHLVQLKNLIAP